MQNTKYSNTILQARANKRRYKDPCCGKQRSPIWAKPILSFMFRCRAACRSTWFNALNVLCSIVFSAWEFGRKQKQNPEAGLTPWQPSFSTVARCVSRRRPCKSVGSNFKKVWKNCEQTVKPFSIQWNTCPLPLCCFLIRQILKARSTWGRGE